MTEQDAALLQRICPGVFEVLLASLYHQRWRNRRLRAEEKALQSGAVSTKRDVAEFNRTVAREQLFADAVAETLRRLGPLPEVASGKTARMMEEDAVLDSMTGKPPRRRAVRPDTEIVKAALLLGAGA